MAKGKGNKIGRTRKPSGKFGKKPGKSSKKK